MAESETAVLEDIEAVKKGAASAPTSYYTIQAILLVARAILVASERLAVAVVKKVL